MDLVFVCLRENKVFNSSNYELIDNNGVKTDEYGNKTLDARVMLTDPCPVCGERHVYHVSELSCPFNG